MTDTMQATTQAQPTEEENREFRFPADRLETLDKEISKLARRARKIGAVEPTYTVLCHFDRVWLKTDKLIDTDEQGAIVIDPENVKRRGRFVSVRINGPVITVDGWTFAATVEHTEAGNAIKRAPYWMGVEVDIPHGYREGAPHCDHCNTIRRRKDSFLVTDGNGGWKQIGRNCLADFLGRDPRTAAWSVMFWETVAGSCADPEDMGWGGCGGSLPVCHPFNEFVMATFHSVRCDGWLSRSAAYQSYNERAATADLAWNLITPIQGSDRCAREAESRRQAEYDSIKSSDREKAENALSWTRDTLTAKGTANRSDYEQNLFIALCKPSVEHKDAGIVASLVIGYKRHIEDELKRRERKAKSNEHIGTVGERVHELTLIVVKFREFPSAYGTRIMAQYEDADGNSLIHWGAKYPEDKDTGKDADVGDTVTASWTIKDHKEYKGRKQTLLTRPAKTKVQKAD